MDKNLEELLKQNIVPPNIDKYVKSKELNDCPPYYISETGMKVIDVIEAFTFDLKGIEATDTGEVLKHICCWKNKDGLKDLKTARWYLDHLINHVEKMIKEND